MDVGDGPDVDVLDDDNDVVVDDEDDGDDEGIDVTCELVVATGAVDLECDPKKV